MMALALLLFSSNLKIFSPANNVDVKSTMPLLVSNEPKPKAVEILNGLEIRDMQIAQNGLFILTPNRVYIIDRGVLNRTYQESIKQVIELGEVNDPQGFFIAPHNGNTLINDIYIADTGNNRVIRYLQNDNYQQDQNYELRYDFNQPIDLIGDDQSIDILDRGNNRIVSFENNQFKSIFTGEGTLNGRFQNPISLSLSGSLVDRDGDLLRDIYYFLGTESAIKIDNLSYSKLGKVYSKEILADRDNQEIIITRFAKVQNKIKVGCSPTMALHEGFNNEYAKVYFACQEKKGLFYIEPYAKPKGARAIDIANKFVEAIKSKNIFALMHLSLYNPKVVFSMNLSILSDILQKTKEVKIGKDNNYVVAAYYTDYKIDNKKVVVAIHLKKADGTFIKTDEWYVDRIKLSEIKDEK